MFGVDSTIQDLCLFCGGTGHLKAFRMARQLNGPGIVRDTVYIDCAYCNGTGKVRSNTSAPSSRRTE